MGRDPEGKEERTEYEERKPNTLLLVTVTVILILLIGISLLFFLRVKNVSVKGNRAYAKEEIETMIFPDEAEKSLLIILYREKTGKHKTFPFIISYHVNLTGTDSCEVIVYEKKPIGYVSYMGSCMYFDKDGMVIESADEELEGIPEITGLRFGKIVLNKKLEVMGSAVFEKILNITSQLESYGIPIETIHIGETGDVTVTVEGGGIRVKLGNDDAFAEKLSILNDVFEKLKDRKGTADLSGYNDLRSDGFSFIPDE